MDAVSDAVVPLVGPQGAAIIVLLLAFVAWALRTVPEWVSRMAGGVHGSPSSARYWRARLAEALSQQNSAPAGPERKQFAARVRDARVMVEAHEARRRVGLNGARWAWACFFMFAFFAFFTMVVAVLDSGSAFSIPVLVLLIIMFGFELLALQAVTARDERVNALAAAGQYGHSKFVRDDPWLVLRVYDHWRSSIDRRGYLKTRTEQDSARTSRGTKFERALVAVAVWPAGLSVDHDIWAALSADDGGTGDETEQDD